MNIGKIKNTVNGFRLPLCKLLMVMWFVPFISNEIRILLTLILSLMISQFLTWWLMEAEILEKNYKLINYVILYIITFGGFPIIILFMFGLWLGGKLR